VSTTTAFTKILVANRGEIALRIFRTARRMGYATVAVYSEADANALHVGAASEAVCIGAPPPRESYLNIGAIIAAAKKTGADAIHPGYGFLSENAEFAQAVLDAGVVWIGPTPESMHAMGNKAGAKRLLADKGVPMLPGYAGHDQTADVLANEAARIGVPLMIKAAAGGGGRGMRLVHDLADFPAQLTRAQSEALSAFGSSDVILERALLNPRHVEIQVFGDQHGNLIHLGERDCSVQRRHQKVIEEAPSPQVDASLRRQIGTAAVNAAKAVQYQGAGTIEFLMEGGQFYFMEMNTRLQVEHPVTEALTGYDLVEWQLRVARGEKLPASQEEALTRFEAGGHAVEVRLCAEDPARDFMPAAGRVLRWQPPSGSHIRIESALADGVDVPPFYDSMVAKVIAHAPTRTQACTALAHTLDDTVCLGLVTNKAFLSACLRHPVFLAGDATTPFIATHFAQGASSGPSGDQARSSFFALAAACLAQATAARYGERGNWSNSAREMVFLLRDCSATEAKPVEVRLSVSSGAKRPFHADFQAVAAGNTHSIGFSEALPATSGGAIELDGVRTHYVAHQAGHDLHLAVNGQTLCFADVTHARPKRADTTLADGVIKANMNARVAAIVNAKPGDIIKAGTPLVVLEAMKMEHPLVLKADVTLKAIHVQVGTQVAPPLPLVEFAAVAQ
jgi:geranyl-CoA carboxylase alpha subunit